MSEHSEAWLLHAGAAGTPGELVLATIPLPELSGDRLLVEPLFGCWGGNMTHALQRSPLDICRQRGEPWVVLGNSAVVRILALGPDVGASQPAGAPVRGPDPAATPADPRPRPVRRLRPRMVRSPGLSSRPFSLCLGSLDVTFFDCR